MEQCDRNAIQKNIVPLSKLVNVQQIAEVLIGRGVIDHEFLERIQVQVHQTTFQKNQEFFLMYTKRGPKAFSLLVQALMDTGHVSEARLLAGEDEEQFRLRVTQRNRIGSVESASESESLSSSENSNSSGLAGGVQPISSSSSSSSGGPSSGRSGSGKSSKIKEINDKSEVPSAPNVSPTSALRQLDIGTEKEGIIAITPPPSPIITTRIEQAKEYNQGILSEEKAYPMMSSPRGYALIINNINFPSDPEAHRKGAEHDSENLRLLFEELGFSTTVRLDIRKRDLTHHSEGIIRKFRDQFHSHPPVDAAIICVMSHGEESNKIRTSDFGHTYVDLFEDIITPFNNSHCPALFGKPKVFIIQTCQGGNKDRGMRQSQTDGKNLMAASSSAGFYDEPDDLWSGPWNNPSFEDMLLCFSTIPGFVSNRDTERGTWYVQLFVEAVRKHAHNFEMFEILREVGRKMRVVENEHGEKQMCSHQVIGFHRFMYFNPGIFADDD